MKDKKRFTREAIIHASMQLLCTADYDNITIRAIARKARVTPSNIYKHFENKEMLIAALYNDIVEEMLSGLHASAGGAKDTRTKLHRITAFYMGYYQGNPYIAMIIYRRDVLKNWMVSDEAFQRARKFGTFFIKILKDGQEMGDVRRDLDLRIINWIYHGGIRQMVLSWLYRGDSLRLTDIAEGYADAIYTVVKCGNQNLSQFMCPYSKEAKPGNTSKKSRTGRKMSTGLQRRGS